MLDVVEAYKAGHSFREVHALVRREDPTSKISVEAIRQRVKKAGVPIRPPGRPSGPSGPGAQIHTSIVVEGANYRTLRRHAERLGRTPTALLNDLLDAVLESDLVVAVLDE